MNWATVSTYVLGHLCSTRPPRRPCVVTCQGKSMKSSSKQSTTIRRGRPEDVEAILNLLTEYDLPRSYFEPFYLNDSRYRPEHSWVVEQQGWLLSHLRVYDRLIRVDRAKLRIAGIGNVITTHDARGQSYTGRIIQAILPVLHQEGYAYSLLWT